MNLRSGNYWLAIKQERNSYSKNGVKMHSKAGAYIRVIIVIAAFWAFFSWYTPR
ncbi:MAG: hypothetical protein ACI9H8_002313 [Lysobacterales bacterium]|jgi:hypothetical protein